MCTGATIALAVISGLSAAGGAYASYEQGQTQKEWAEYNADQAEADAKAEQGAAEVRADKIRKAARAQAAQATAALAGSGVNVNEGTALNINQDIYQSAEEDALMEIFGGKDLYSRGMASASASRTKGNQAAQAGTLGAANSLLGGGASIAKGWATNK